VLALDTNLLIYAAAKSGRDPREAVSDDIVRRSFLVPTVVPLQVFGEFLNACRNKRLLSPAVALARVEEWRALFRTPATAADQLASAALLAERSQLQFWDALIATVSRAAGATLLLSEDMHDGLELGGLTVLNPFIAANAARIEAALV